MKLYCPTCGAGTSYSLSKPRFCASCGKSFTGSNNTAQGKVGSNAQVPTVSAAPQKHEEEDEREIFEVPNIDKLALRSTGL